MTLTRTPTELVEARERAGTAGLVACSPAWSRTQLSQIAKVTNGAAFKSADFNTVGQGAPLIRIRDVGTDTVGTWTTEQAQVRCRVRPGDLLVGMDGDFRARVWHGPEALLNQRVCKVEVTSPNYEQSFLNLVLQGYLEMISDSTSATTVKHLSSKSIQQIPLPHPPLPEQRRIVEIVEEQVAHLDAADASLASAERRLSALQDGVIRSAVLGQGSLGPHLPSPLEAVGTNDGELEPLPPGWRWARLHEVADVVGGVTKDAKKQDDPNYVAVPYLRVANVQRGSLNLDTVTTIRVAPHRAAALELKVGDVLLNEGGDRDKLARGWVWEGQIPACIHQNHVFRARVRDITIDPYFLSHAANAIGGKWAERNGKQTTNLASISLSMIKKMPVPVPPNGQSKKIASEIALRLEGLARQSDAISVAKRRSAVLRRTVLAAAFSGRLTTHTDAVGSLPGASADD